MNQEVKKQWVEALRSGDYRQGRNCLRSDENGDRFCCLGVLCDLRVGDGVGFGEWKKECGNFEFAAYRDNGAPNPLYGAGYVESMVLPNPIAEFLDAGSRNGQLKDLYDRDGEEIALTVLNDQGFTFGQIADLIEYWL